MSSQDSHSTLEEGYWSETSEETTPDWAVELLEIEGVIGVMKYQAEMVAVDVAVEKGEDGVAKTPDQCMYRITSVDGISLGGWSIQSVRLMDEPRVEHETIKLVLGSRVPICNEQNCREMATHEIDNVMLDGSLFKVKACDDH